MAGTRNTAVSKTVANLWSQEMLRRGAGWIVVVVGLMRTAPEHLRPLSEREA